MHAAWLTAGAFLACGWNERVCQVARSAAAVVRKVGVFKLRIGGIDPVR